MPTRCFLEEPLACTLSPARSSVAKRVAQMQLPYTESCDSPMLTAIGLEPRVKPLTILPYPWQLSFSIVQSGSMKTLHMVPSSLQFLLPFHYWPVAAHI